MWVVVKTAFCLTRLNNDIIVDMETVSWSLPENDPEVSRLIKKDREDSTWSSTFAHIGSTKNGSFTREWTTQDFRRSINLLRDPETDLDAFYRTILRDPVVCQQFSERYHFDPKEFWENYISDFPEEVCDYETYVRDIYPTHLPIDVEREAKIGDYSDAELLKFLKIYNARIGRCTGNNELRPMFLGQFFNLLIIE